MKKKIALIIATLLTVAALAGCTQAEKVSYNVSQDADNFNVVRQLVVINAMTDKPVFELIGNFSFELTENYEGESGVNRIIIIVEVSENKYEKHSVGLPEFALWYVRDVSGADVNTFQYQINFQPESIIPFELTNDY